MPKEATSRVNQLSIFMLAVEWVFFGSCHFTFPEATIAEIPHSIPFKPFIVATTGMIEVATGILILLPKTRKWAALTSLVLLFLYLPAVYHMLVFNSAISDTEAWRDVVRVLLVPNNVFLALCAIHIWSSKDSLAIGPAQVLEGVLSHRRASTSPAATPIVAAVMLLANIAGFVVIVGSPWHQSPAYLWAMMCLATGALAGFLFGVPRVNLEATKSTALRPNTNIEVVSDWLTKIIVGVGLVEFREVGRFLTGISLELGQSLVPQTGAVSFAKSLIVYFFVSGMIQGYLLTRMYLGEQFQNNE